MILNSQRLYNEKALVFVISEKALETMNTKEI